jgi:uncharacterized protein (DUF1015 family)
MAVVKPLGALRYGPGADGPLERLVAPPYDVISPAERDEYRARSPHNVVHLTLPEDETAAARLWAEWRRDAVLVAEEPEFWALSQEYVGPDGVPRTRNGLVGALRVEPYERGVVLPHERTHRGPKEGRLRLLRAVRAELEPIFLLHDGPPVATPARAPDLAVAGARLWRLDEDLSADFADRILLIADGHHRYETALAYHREEGTEASAYMMVVLVSTAEPGLTIFATHRIAERVGETNGSEPAVGVGDALARLDELPRDRPAVAVYRGGEARIVKGDEPELDADFVQRFQPQGVAYTSRADEAVAAVDSGRAEAAFLLRSPTIDQVRAVAERGETMPQKSTYFYPKLVSGLLFQPLD